MREQSIRIHQVAQREQKGSSYTCCPVIHVLICEFLNWLCPWTKNAWAAQSNKGWNLMDGRAFRAHYHLTNVWLLRGNFSMKRCQVELKTKQLNSNTLAIKRYNYWDKCKERDRKKFPVTHEYSCWRERPAQTLFMSPWSLTLIPQDLLTWPSSDFKLMLISHLDQFCY